MAVDKGHLEIVSAISAGMTADLAKNDGATPLFVACQLGHVDIARMLIEKGADGGQARNDGVSPLFMACQNGHRVCAQLRLDAGGSVNQAKENGTTPLFMACQEGPYPVERLLLAHAAPADASGAQHAAATRAGGRRYLGAAAATTVSTAQGSQTPSLHSSHAGTACSGPGVCA